MLMAETSIFCARSRTGMAAGTLIVFDLVSLIWHLLTEKALFHHARLAWMICTGICPRPLSENGFSAHGNGLLLFSLRKRLHELTEVFCFLGRESHLQSPGNGSFQTCFPATALAVKVCASTGKFSRSIDLHAIWAAHDTYQGLLGFNAAAANAGTLWDVPGPPGFVCGHLLFSWSPDPLPVSSIVRQRVTTPHRRHHLPVCASYGPRPGRFLHRIQ
jgi:hypothetical protein